MAKDSEVKQVKRGRGRPPKAETEKKTVANKREAVADVGEDEAPAVKRGRGRPKGSTKAKGRGRPKKVKVEEINAEVNEEAEDSGEVSE